MTSTRDEAYPLPYNLKWKDLLLRQEGIGATPGESLIIPEQVCKTLPDWVRTRLAREDLKPGPLTVFVEALVMEPAWKFGYGMTPEEASASKAELERPLVERRNRSIAGVLGEQSKAITPAHTFLGELQELLGWDGVESVSFVKWEHGQMALRVTGGGGSYETLFKFNGHGFVSPGGFQALSDVRSRFGSHQKVSA